MNFIDLINSTSGLLKSIAALIVAIIILISYIKRRNWGNGKGRDNRENTGEQRGRPIRVRSVLLGILLIVIFAVIFIFLTTPVIKITYPRNGDEVNFSIKVHGTISGELPNGQYMWLVVNPQNASGSWWPQGGRINPWKGQWDMQATFGGTQDIGTNFTIAVILVGEDDDKNLYEEVKKVNTSGVPLPYKATVKDEVIVKKVGN